MSKPKPSSDVITRVGAALKRATSRPNSLANRVSDRFAIPQLWHHYTQNVLTQGHEYLAGPDELPLFDPNVWHAPLKWRPIPGPHTVSLSKATLTSTDAGTAMLRGEYGGSRGEVALLAGGSSKDLEGSAVGPTACGVASMGHWSIDLCQHHWLELRVRTGHRAFELVIQSDGAYEGSARLWRASIPAAAVENPGRGSGDAADGKPGGGASGARAHGGGATSRGAYGVLNVASDATDEEIRESYRGLVMKLHPDRGATADEERFKAVSKAYALIGDPERRKRYDEFGAELGDGESDEAGVDDLGPWRDLKIPFTAFKDRAFWFFADKVSVVYVLLAEEGTPGPFALEIGQIKAGRCEKAHLSSAGLVGHVSCEQGHCECGYYNGLRVEAFEGPFDLSKVGNRLPPGWLQWGFAEHHLREGEFHDM
jgi:curved DNA-binding protein CbpA